MPLRHLEKFRTKKWTNEWYQIFSLNTFSSVQSLRCANNTVSPRGYSWCLLFRNNSSYCWIFKIAVCHTQWDKLLGNPFSWVLVITLQKLTGISHNIRTLKRKKTIWLNNITGNSMFMFIDARQLYPTTKLKTKLKLYVCLYIRSGGT